MYKSGIIKNVTKQKSYLGGKNMKQQQLREEQIITNVSKDYKVELNENFRDEGVTWYLVPCETKAWPNGNPHRVLYENLLGNRLVIWLNEVGNMIYNHVYA